MKSASSKQEDEIRRALAGRGIPFTTRRAEILNFFANSPRGRTISEVASAMSKKGIGQATVYRAVSLFLDRGLLCRINNGAGKTRLAAVHSGHAHPVVCSKCNATVDIDSCDLSVLEKLASIQTGFKIHGHQLVLYGICPKCFR